MEILVEHGRARVHVITLQRNGATVGSGIVLRAQLRIGDVCLDTDDSLLFTLEEDGTELHAKLGLVTALVPRNVPYPAHLTVFDGSDDAGLPWWDQQTPGAVKVIPWPVCPAA